MDWFRKTKGAISIFLCIVMVIMIALTGALVDGARIRAAETEVRGALDTSVLSELSNYNNILKELYGLFALAGDDTGIMRESIEYSLSRNLLADLGKAKEVGFDKYYSDVLGFLNKDKTNPLNLFDYKIESTRSDGIYNLSEPEVIKRQILETMKYKAPKEIADVFLDRFLSIKDLGEQSKILERKLDLDEKLNEGRKSQEELSQKAYDINSLGRENEIKSRLSELASKIAERIQKEKELKDTQKQLADLKPPVSTSSNNGREAGIETDAYDEQKRNLQKRIDELDNSIEACRKEAARIKDKLVEYIDRLISDGAFVKAKEAADNVIEKSEEAGAMANDLSKTIAEDSSSFGESIRTDLKAKKDKIDTSVLIERQAEIEQCRKVFDEIKAMIASIDPDSISIDPDNLATDITGAVKEKLPFKRIESKLNNYPTVNYYVKALNEREEKKDDPRDVIDNSKNKIEEQTKNLLQNIKSGDALIKGKFPSSGLPSQGGVVNSIDGIKDLFENDGRIIGQNRELAESALNKFNPDYKGMDNVSGDFSGDNQSDFSKKGLSIISGLADMMSDGLSAMRDELYVDEYVIGTFKNAVTGKLKQNGTTQYDLNGYDILKRQNTFFSDAEVEYILHGEKTQEANVMWTKGQILLVRWALNTIAIYCDPSKVSTALEIATAIAGWTVFGVPIIQTLILLAWSFAESLIDVYTLMSGGEVQIFKTKGCWTLDITGAAGNAAGALKSRLLDSARDDVLKLAKNKAIQVIDHTADEIAVKLEKGANSEVEKITSNISTQISGIIENKVDQVIDSAFKPFEDAVYSEVGKIQVEFDDLKESVFARERDMVDGVEDEADKFMKTVDDAIYNGVRESFPQARKILGDNGYDSLVKQLRDKEKQFYEELKNKGFDLLGKKEKEIRNRIDKEEEKIISSIKGSILKARKSLKDKILDRINMGLGSIAAGSDIKSKINDMVNRKINDAIEIGKDNTKRLAKEKLTALFDKMGGKSKGSSLKAPTTDKNFSFTSKTNIKGSFLKLDYRGYLRILLLIMNPDKKIKRIQDLIQLNMVKETGNSGFSLTKCNTCLRVEAEVSVRYFFMTSAIMPKKFKGRYKVSNTVYKGY